MSAGAQPAWKPPEADRETQAWTPPVGDRPAETPGYLSQVGAGLWSTVKGLARLGSEAGGLASDPLHAITHLKALKQLVLDPQVDQALEAAHKWETGDHSEAVGHALAAILPGVGPAAANIGDKLGSGDIKGAAADATTLGATMAAPHLASAVADVAPRAAGAVAAGAKAAAPDVAVGAGKVAAGAIASEVLPGGPLRYVAGAAPVYSGVRQISRGLSKGFEAGKASLAERINAATEAMAAPEAAADEALLKFSGLSQEEFNGLKPQEQQAIRNLAANAQPATRPATPPPAPPQAAPVPVPAAAPASPRSLTEMIQAEIAARNPQPPGRTPLRPPLAQPAPQPPESANVPPASAPRVPLSPPVGPAAPQSLVEAIAPQSTAVPPNNPPNNLQDAVAPSVAPPKPPSQAQIDAWMAKKAPAPLEEPRSMYTSTGERKSPELRAAELTGANVAAKAQRFVQVLHDAGVTSADARSIPVGRLSVKQIQDGGMPGWGNITDDLVSKGVLKAGENPPSQSIPEIVKGLKKLEAQKIAAELADEMKRSGTVK